MIRHIPPFILQQYEQGKLEGELSGYIFWPGITGQPQLGGRSAQRYKEGAVELGAFLNHTGTRMFSTVDSNGGFICQSEGSTLFALFPQANPANVLAAAAELNSMAEELAASDSQFRDHADQFVLRIGYGTVQWRIFPNDLQAEYIFYGSLMRELSCPYRKGSQPEFTTRAVEKLGLEHFRRNGKDWELVLPVPAALPSPLDYPHSVATAQRFTQARFHYIAPVNDLRHSICCWIDLGSLSSPQIANRVQTLELLSVTYNGFISSIAVRQDKLRAVVLFDIPRNGGHKLRRACKFALEAIKNIPEARVGCATGMLYSGFCPVGQSLAQIVLGKPLPVAESLAAQATPGEICTDAYLRRQLRHIFRFSSAGHARSGSKGHIIPYYLLTAMPLSPATGPQSAFIGRQVELFRLRRLVQKKPGKASGRMIQVWGPAGIGKSRLVGEVFQSCSAEDYHKFYISCQELLSRPLDAVIQLIASHLQLPGANPETADLSAFRRAWSQFAANDPALLEIEATVASLFGLIWPGSLWDMQEPHERPRQRQKAWLLFMTKLVLQKPVLIHLDDGQWLDAQSREYFRLLGKNQIGPVVILASNRPLEDESRPSLDIPGYHSHSLELSPLRRSCSKRLWRSLLGIRRLAESTFDHLHRYTAGNPFYIEQYVIWLLENSLIDTQGRLAPTADPAKLPGIAEIIIGRISHLSGKVRQCIHSASVLGFRFNVRVLSQMLKDDPRKELVNGAGNSLWKDVDDLFYIFSHTLIRTAVYNYLRENELENLHLAAAQAMEIVFSGRLCENSEEIGFHYRKAGKLAKATHYYQIAGDFYWDLGLLPKAETIMREAIRLAKAAFGENSPEHTEQRFFLALLLHYLHRMDEAEEIYLQVVAAKTAELGTQSPGLSPYLNNLGRFYKDTGRYREAEKLLKRSLQIEKKQCPTSSNVADRINNLAHLYSIMGRLDKAEATFREALDLMEQNYEPWHWFTAVCLGNLGGVILQQGRLEEAEPLLLRSVAIASGHWGENHPSTAVYLFRLGKLRLEQSRHSEAETLFKQVLAAREATFGKDHALTLAVVEALAEIHSLLGQ